MENEVVLSKTIAKFCIEFFIPWSLTEVFAGWAYPNGIKRIKAHGRF